MTDVTAKKFRDTVVFPALTRIGLYSLTAEKLLMGTAAIESRFTLVTQLGGGPGRGVFQMEPATFNWLLSGILTDKNHADLRKSVFALAGTNKPVPNLLMVNALFAAAMARVRYYVVPSPIPSTLEGQAYYWRKNYNGESIHGLTEADYIKRWNDLCAPLYGASHASSPPDTSGYPYTPLQAPIWV
jgi:hypothetical protein